MQSSRRILPRSHAQKSRTVSADNVYAPTRFLPATLSRRVGRLQRAAARWWSTQRFRRRATQMRFSANRWLGISCLMPSRIFSPCFVLSVFRTMSYPNSLRTIAHPNRVWRLIFSPMILPCPSRDNGNRNREFPERGAPDSDRRDH